MRNTDIIKDLLNKLSAEHPHISWSVKCCFTDGQGNSFHQIRLQWRKPKKEKSIFFQMETGMILLNSCQKQDGLEADNVVDVLLDLMNEEKLSVSHTSSI
jgi:hypothetical protein